MGNKLLGVLLLLAGIRSRKLRNNRKSLVCLITHSKSGMQFLIVSL